MLRTQNGFWTVTSITEQAVYMADRAQGLKIFKSILFLHYDQEFSGHSY